jgi:Leucine-rich repeat (LRR) protein
MNDTANPRLRWYDITPDRVVIGLLAVEGLLLLSERFEWFGKGCPVLIALAALAVATLLMLVWFAVALISRRRFQFSIRSLFVLMLAVATPFGWLAAEMKDAREQEDAMEEIRKWDWDVRYDWQKTLEGTPGPRRPAWLRSLLGEDFFARATFARCDIRYMNTGLAQLERFNELKWLHLSGPKVTDAGLEHLRGLTQLQELRLFDARVTDAGLENFKGLTKLQRLALDGTKITDAGLEHLKGLKQLQELSLSRIQVTDAGLANLNCLTNLRCLMLNDTEITEAGLERLKGLKELQELWLEDTKITEVGLENLKSLKQLQVLWLSGPQVTDNGLRHLAGLKQLRVLWLDRIRGIHVTNQGMKTLMQTLPNCEVKCFDLTNVPDV